MTADDALGSCVLLGRRALPRKGCSQPRSVTQPQPRAISRGRPVFVFKLLAAAKRPRLLMRLRVPTRRLNSHFPTAAPRAAAGAHTDTPTGRAAVQSLLRQQPACTGPRGPRACRERPHGAVLFPHPTDGQREDTFSRKAARARAARRYGRFRVAAKRSTWKLLLLRAAKGRAHGAEDVRAARQSPRQVRSWWKDFF